MIADFLSSASDSMREGGVEAAFIFELTGKSNTRVGYLEAVAGITGLIFAFPGGWAADKFPRTSVIRVGIMGIPFYCVLCGFAVIWGAISKANSTVAYFAYIGAMVVSGIVTETAFTSSEALYIDSIHSKHRAWYLTKRYQLYEIVHCVGPLVTIALIAIHGDQWELTTLRNVILVSLGISLFTIVPMGCMRDSCSLDEDDENDVVTSNTATQVPPYRWIVPHVLFWSELCSSLGSGMTIKFFPLYFKGLGLSPIVVQTIYIILPILMAAFQGIATQAARCCGSLRVLIGFSIMGVSLLTLMACVDWILPPPTTVNASNTNHTESTGNVINAGEHTIRVAFIIAVYLMRTVFMNCTGPLFTTIQMQYIPKSTRARWLALSSVTSLGWSGSAMLGGYIADKHSYSTTFLVTAGLQTLSICITMSLCWVIPRADDIEHGTPDALSR